MPNGSNLFDIKPAVRENTPAFIALAGPSGSGKTRSALELAVGLAGPSGRILLADSEGRRALHYADLYKFDHVEWHPPFTPESIASLIDLAEGRGYTVLIVDSASDEFEGEGGLQEIAAATKDEFWARTKARHKHALVNRMRRSKIHLIFCLRAEERVRIEKVYDERKGREVTAVTPLGWQPICEKRFLYEVQSSFLFHPATDENPDAPGRPIPIKLYDIHAQFFPADQKITRAAGAELAKWCAGGVAPVAARDLPGEAEAAAAKGSVALSAFWKGLAQVDRRQIAHLIAVDGKPGPLALAAKAVDANGHQPELPDEIPLGEEIAAGPSATKVDAAKRLDELRGLIRNVEAVADLDGWPESMAWGACAEKITESEIEAGKTEADARVVSDNAMALLVGEIEQRRGELVPEREV